MTAQLTPDILSKVTAQWADAVNIRHEGKCDICKHPTLLSLQLPDDVVRGDGWETCGYYCYRCGWSNAGAREVKPSADVRAH